MHRYVQKQKLEPFKIIYIFIHIKYTYIGRDCYTAGGISDMIRVQIVAQRNRKRGQNNGVFTVVVVVLQEQTCSLSVVYFSKKSSSLLQASCSEASAVCIL